LKHEKRKLDEEDDRRVGTCETLAVGRELIIDGLTLLPLEGLLIGWTEVKIEG
jgi:hypothetical protein